MENQNPLRLLVKNPTLIKIMGTTILTFVLLIPLSSIEDLVAERSQRVLEVSEELQQQWGPPISLRGPILVVPTIGTHEHHFITLDTLSIQGDIPVVERYRNIFRLPTYRSTMLIRGTVKVAPERAPSQESNRVGAPSQDTNRTDAAPSQNTNRIDTAPSQDTNRIDTAPSSLDWNNASWVFLLGAKSDGSVAGHIDVNGLNQPLRKAFNEHGIPGPVLHAPAIRRGGTVTLAATIEAFGSDTLDLTPFGESVAVVLKSDWPHPSFNGARLPTSRTVDDSGFAATWHLDSTTSGMMTSQIGDSLADTSSRSPAITVRFIDAVSHYHQVTRGVKYALFIIVITFVTFFLFEVVARLSIHPIQYLFIGCALVVFYLLLLSLSEHLAFGLSYLIAASAVVVLIFAYARTMLVKESRAALCGLGLGATYGLLYVILREETLALLAGSWALFALLALVMFLTRRVNWNTIGQKARNSLPLSTSTPERS